PGLPTAPIHDPRRVAPPARPNRRTRRAGPCAGGAAVPGGDPRRVDQVGNEACGRRGQVLLRATHGPGQAPTWFWTRSIWTKVTENASRSSKAPPANSQ